MRRGPSRPKHTDVGIAHTGGVNHVNLEARHAILAKGPVPSPPAWVT